MVAWDARDCPSNGVCVSSVEPFCRARRSLYHRSHGVRDRRWNVSPHATLFAVLTMCGLVSKLIHWSLVATRLALLQYNIQILYKNSSQYSISTDVTPSI